MKLFKHIYPGLMGLLIYTAIRLITDTASRYNVLMYRDWVTNTIEIIAAILVGYLIFWLLNRFEKSRNSHVKLSFREILKEFITISVITLIAMNATIGVLTATTDNGMDLHDFVMINLVPLLFVLVIYSIRRGNSYLNSYVEQKMELERIKRDKTETELSLLKSQYHPHFLFNTLNTVYFQMDDSIDSAKKTIEKLSELLRYQLYEDHHEKVTLKKELDFVKKYVALQRERLPGDVRIKMDIDKTGDQMIYPLLTIPLVENAFKYVGGKEKFIQLKCLCRGNFVEFSIINSYDKRMNGSKYSGLGIANLERRLELLYPDQSELQLTKDDKQFSAQLKLPTL